MSEIDRLRRMEQFQANDDILSGRVVTDNSKVNENLLAENQRLRTALEHYADENNWDSPRPGLAKMRYMCGDGFKIASAALGGE